MSVVMALEAILVHRQGMDLDSARAAVSAALNGRTVDMTANYKWRRASGAPHKASGLDVIVGGSVLRVGLNLVGNAGPGGEGVGGVDDDGGRVNAPLINGEDPRIGVSGSGGRGGGRGGGGGGGGGGGSGGRGEVDDGGRRSAAPVSASYFQQDLQFESRVEELTTDAEARYDNCGAFFFFECGCVLALLVP